MDFRLKVFYTVAKRLSFTKASAELFMTQPAVTKHVHELEEEYKIKLFERLGNKITLTNAGELLLKQSERIFEIYRDIDFELNALTRKRSGALRLGASTTLSQYIIPPLLAGFHQRFKEVKVSLLNGNTEQVEKLLLKKDIELGIIEGRSKDPSIKYTEFLKDELVLVCSSKNPLSKKEELMPADLKKLSFIMRERGSGTLEVIEHGLKPFKLKLSQLTVEMQLGSTESIKSYLMHSNSVAFISIHAITKELKNNELRIVDVKGLSIERWFYLISLQGKEEALSELFKRYALHDHLK